MSEGRSSKPHPAETRIAMLVTHVRAEEKLLHGALAGVGLSCDVLLDRDVRLDLLADAGQAAPNGRRWREYDVILIRTVSQSRGLMAALVLESWGLRVINRYETAALCADKARTTLTLAQAGIPQPGVRLAFTPAAGLTALEELGYPAVLKPVVGSWGRLLARVRDVEEAEAILEHRQTLGGYTQQVVYAQEYIEKPGRDIRAFVIGERPICAIYRSSPHWVTNTARGGRASNCPLTPNLVSLCERAAAAVGGGLLALDVLEAPDGRLLLNEINHTMEFRNSSAPTGVDIAAAVAEYVREEALRLRARPE